MAAIIRDLLTDHIEGSYSIELAKFNDGECWKILKYILKIEQSTCEEQFEVINFINGERKHTQYLSEAIRWYNNIN